MDPLTQGLLGSTICGAMFSKQLGRWSWVVGLAGGMLADADMVFSLWVKPLEALYLHRQFTHAFWFIPIGGLIAALPFMLVSKMRLRRKTLILGAMAAYATHAPLDMLTSYGTPFFWPFDYTRISLDILPIVDPIFTLILLIGTIALTIRRSTKIGRVTLLLIAMYVALAATQHNRATNAQLALIDYRNASAKIARVLPTPGNILVWHSVYKTATAIQTDLIRVPLSSEPAQIIEGRHHSLLPRERIFKRHKIAPDSQLAKDLDQFEWFAGGLVAPISNQHPNWLADLRYTVPMQEDQPLWYIKVHFKDPTLPAELVHSDIDRKKAMADLWQIIKAAPDNAKPVTDYYPAMGE